MEEDSEAMRALLEVLARIALDWSGKCTPVPTQLDISSPEGQMPVDRYLERQRPDAPISRAQMGGAGLRAFQAIAGEWGLALKEQLALLAVPATTYRRQKTAALAGKDVALAPSNFERLGIVLGIYRDLHILLPQHPAQWLRNPNSNPIFAGKPPLDRMLAGNVADLCAIRQYLDAWRGGPVDHYLSEHVVTTCNLLEAATTPYDSADYLKTEADMAAYLEAAQKDGDPKLLALVQANIARAKLDQRFAAMQSPQARAEVRALFRATPKELGQAAVRGAVGDDLSPTARKKPKKGNL